MCPSVFDIKCYNDRDPRPDQEKLYRIRWIIAKLLQQQSCVSQWRTWQKGYHTTYDAAADKQHAHDLQKGVHTYKIKKALVVEHRGYDFPQPLATVVVTLSLPAP